MALKKSLRGGERNGAGRKRRHRVRIAVRVTTETAEWLRFEAAARMPIGTSRLEIGLLVEEIVSKYRSHRNAEQKASHSVTKIE